MIHAARRSSRGGSSTRNFAGTTASISCVSAPNAQIRPQYSRPQSTVDTRVKPANRYQARLYLKIGRFQIDDREDVDDRDQLALRRSPCRRRRPRSVTYFSRTLLRKKLTSANAMNAASERSDRAPAGARMSRHVSDGVHYFERPRAAGAAPRPSASCRGWRASALLMLIDARETASTSPPTRNGSRMLLPLNCAANFGGSTEK